MQLTGKASHRTSGIYLTSEQSQEELYVWENGGRDRRDPKLFCSLQPIGILALNDFPNDHIRNNNAHIKRTVVQNGCGFKYKSTIMRTGCTEKGIKIIRNISA